jgi:MoxR-like ATPase
MVQGTAGTPEEAIRYGWNYALLLAKGPSRDALVPGPVMRGMAEGKLVRFEELTRVPSEVQDTLITILSEKTLPIPELNSETRAVRGFNIIATANDRDRGVNELSSAASTRWCCPCPTLWTMRSRSSTSAWARWAGRWHCPENCRPSRRSAAW